MYEHRLQHSVTAKDLHMRHRDTIVSLTQNRKQLLGKEIFLKIRQANILLKLSKCPAKKGTKME